jgi:hypothetical protein
MQCVVTLLNLHKTMFGLSLPPAVCRRACVFLTLFVFVCAYRCPTHIVFGVFLRLVSCLPNVASFSGLSILDCPFGFLYHLFNWYLIECAQRLSGITFIKYYQIYKIGKAHNLKYFRRYKTKESKQESNFTNIDS